MDVVEKKSISSLNMFEHAGIRYMTNGKMIYKLKLPKYTINIGAFGDWSVHNDLFKDEEYFYHILKPSFTQKRKMKKIWKNVDTYMLSKRNEKDMRIKSRIMEI